jgi:hypothetical protein
MGFNFKGSFFDLKAGVSSLFCFETPVFKIKLSWVLIKRLQHLAVCKRKTKLDLLQIGWDHIKKAY